MANIFEVSEQQRDAIIDIVRESWTTFFIEGYPPQTVTTNIPIGLMVHDHVNGPLPTNLAHGLPQSPVEDLSSTGQVTFLTGGRQVALELASRLQILLGEDMEKVLYIPHAYANVDEIPSLQEDFDGNVVKVNDKVFVKISGSSVSIEVIRKALGSMIGCYSVGWVVTPDLPDARFCSAIVPVFDGEGWALVGRQSYSQGVATNLKRLN